MKKMLTALLAAAVAGALFIAAPLVAAPKGTNFNKDYDHPGTCEGGDGDNTLVLHGPDMLWPPNHKMFTEIWVTAAGTEPEEAITLTTTGWHNQYVEGDNGLEEQNGAGNTADDIRSDDPDNVMTSAGTAEEGYPTVIVVEEGAGSVTTDWLARAERSGRDQAGRFYTLDADATFGDGGTCEGTITMFVPHDMRPENRTPPVQE